MQIVLIKQEKLYKYKFPNDNITSYWIKDFDVYDNERNLLAIEKIGDNWTLISNNDCYIINSDQVKMNKVNVNINTIYQLRIRENDIEVNALLYIHEETKTNHTSYIIGQNKEYSIGSASDQNILINNPYVSPKHAKLIKDGKGYLVEAIDNKYGIYVNGNKISTKRLETGDKVFIVGTTIIVLNEYIIINNDIGPVTVNSVTMTKKPLPAPDEEPLETIEDDSLLLYDENDYYSRQPRFTTSITEETLKIDSPPGKQEPDETPVILTLGPMLTMTMTSVVTLSTSILNVTKGNSTWAKVIPSIIIAVAMISSTLLWPTLLKKYNKKKMEKAEEKRQKKYGDYLIEKRNKITAIKHNQHQVLMETYPEPKDIQNIIVNRKRNLWERQIESDDFLNVRVGIGTIPLKINLQYSIEDFTMSEDNLKADLERTAETAKEIPNCPVTISLTERNKMVLIGEKQYKETMLKSILLQLATYHAYNDLKLVFMISDNSSDMWENFKMLPHTWSDSKDIRFFANNYEDMSKLSFYLEQTFIARKYTEQDGGKRVENNIDYRNVQPYYLLIVDNIKKIKNLEIIDKILNEERNLGFGLLVLNDGISNLPNEITHFLSADGQKSAIITNDLNKNNQQAFQMDSIEEVNFPLMCEKLSNIPIKSETVLNEMKNSVGFLEMYKVGKVEQLNMLERWASNNPVNSLSVPIGLRSDGELFMLDLHEKFHGPHGLIAGMTGSGKSEFIITFILSMCLNFNPEEVSFVLIDYKGGGLTGAFENKLKGIKLPHLAGTITNLDKAEIKRSLSSIQSELKRRQELFNKAKAELNESTLDIYKYQQLYRNGLIKEPVSHLFIISDEFAELKSQQSEFMNELISTARIGRSLGVHLILATQKPSGIVDDQIWSNSKFKVCLKVQERADSMDVIKCPDAVTLKKAGRFYLQVGYNDFFAMGQSAYAGTKYIPKDKITKLVDRDVSFINNIGDITRSIETVSRVEQVASNGEELSNILNYICELSSENNLVAKKLWLDKIPAEIFVTNLMRKYAFFPGSYNLKAVVGEYDDPNNQRQDLLILDFNENGNTLIYGSDDKEIMLSSIIYSLIINHSAEELNIYVLDFGSEMFSIFSDAPQVGDVIFINQEEKLVNLFNKITKELERRKKLFAAYNGNYNIYIKNSGKKLPRIMIMINNYEVLGETYESYIDTIASLSREGEKYGIFFVISATGVNAVRGKTSQNFATQLCLQFNDEGDYASILGPIRGMIPTAVRGRGLVKLGGRIFEFQTAYPYKWDEINVFIKNICTKLNEKVQKKAEVIAVLPNHVRLQDIESKIDTLSNVPIGIVKETLETSTYNFNRSLISLISAQDISMLDKYISSLLQVLQNIPTSTLYVIDKSETIKDSKKYTNYYSENVVEAFEAMKKEAADTSGARTAMFVIHGVEEFINALGTDLGREFKNFLTTVKGNKNIKFIFSDAVTKIKLYEYEDFFRTCIQPINAIWVGSGITDQYTIKSSTYTRETRAAIPNDFGYNVDRGNATLIKLLDFYTED